MVCGTRMIDTRPSASSSAMPASSMAITLCASSEPSGSFHTVIRR